MNRTASVKFDIFDFVINPSMQLKQIYAIIPAAGKGKRFGKPKTGAIYEHRTFLRHILDTLSETPVAGTKVITDADTADMLATIRIGTESALKDGWNALGWLIWPVDHPFVEVSTINILIRHFWLNPDAVVNPLYADTRGHPLIIPASMELPDNYIEGGLRKVIRSADLKRVDVPVTDPAILKNINYKEDLIQNV